MREIESRYRRPARELITDLADVWFGYTALSVLAGTLLGLLAGVFGYAFFKNRDAEPHPLFPSSPTTSWTAAKVPSGGLVKGILPIKFVELVAHPG